MNASPFRLSRRNTELSYQPLNDLLYQSHNLLQRKFLQHLIDYLLDQSEQTLTMCSLDIADKSTPNVIPEAKVEAVFKHQQPTLRQAILSTQSLVSKYQVFMSLPRAALKQHLIVVRDKYQQSPLIEVI